MDDILSFDAHIEYYVRSATCVPRCGVSIHAARIHNWALLSIVYARALVRRPKNVHMHMHRRTYAVAAIAITAITYN